MCWILIMLSDLCLRTLWGYLHSNVSEHYWRMYDRWHDSRLRRGRARRRELTPIGIRTNSMQITGFLDLAYELRLQIYFSYYDDSKILLTPVVRGLRKKTVGFSVHAERRHRLQGHVGSGNSVQCGLLDLPLACKQMYVSPCHGGHLSCADRFDRYVEVIDILYSHNTFCFHQPAGLIDFRKAILPQRWKSITSIELNESLNWLVKDENIPAPGHLSAQQVDCWNSLLTMPNLQRIVWHPPRHGTRYGRRELVRQPRESTCFQPDRQSKSSSWFSCWDNAAGRLTMPNGLVFVAKANST